MAALVLERSHVPSNRGVVLDAEARIPAIYTRGTDTVRATTKTLLRETCAAASIEAIYPRNLSDYSFVAGHHRRLRNTGRVTKKCNRR